jgi:hypothetical protein
MMPPLPLEPLEDNEEIVSDADLRSFCCDAPFDMDGWDGSPDTPVRCLGCGEMTSVVDVGDLL